MAFTVFAGNWCIRCGVLGMKQYPDSAVVDEQDVVIGQMQLFDAIKQGAILRVVRVFVIDTAGNMLLQKRGANVLFPHMWNEAAAGHVDAGDGYLASAERELLEETGLRANLIEVDHRLLDEISMGIHVRRWTKSYNTLVPPGTNATPGVDEVAELKWFSIDEVASWLNREPWHFTPTFKQYFELSKSAYLQAVNQR